MVMGVVVPALVSIENPISTRRESTFVPDARPRTRFCGNPPAPHTPFLGVPSMEPYCETK